MTLTSADLGLYAFALLVLFLTPGPVWLALIARSMSGGFPAAWPLSLGVAVGDVFWSLFAVLGLAWVTSEIEWAMAVLRWGACGFFLWLGWSVIRNADKAISSDSRLTRPGVWAGFLAGLAAILGNPKAILFYVGILPGFFDLSAVTAPDIAVICLLSLLVPLIGNISFAWFVDRVRGIVRSPRALRHMNMTAGGLLIIVGLALPFT